MLPANKYMPGVLAEKVRRRFLDLMPAYIGDNGRVDLEGVCDAVRRYCNALIDRAKSREESEEVVAAYNEALERFAAAAKSTVK